MYINQQIHVKWNNMIYQTGTISNGVKQGGCMSPTLFSIYCGNLLCILRKSNVGCRHFITEYNTIPTSQSEERHNCSL